MPLIEKQDLPKASLNLVDNQVATEKQMICEALKKFQVQSQDYSTG
ncbi:MAG: hypothetical protein K8R67_12885 [Desulfobacteraceae bacterium]|nr:hypothetical protein [Desulfobacteraceae bacterium]